MRPKKDVTVAKIVGSNIKKYRMKCDKAERSVRSLSGKVGVSPATWYKWENGEVVPEDINQIKIATALGVTIYDLRYGIDKSDIIINSSENNSVPTSNMHPHEPIPFTLEPQHIPVVGQAAADETEGARAGFFPADPDAEFDELDIPETTAAVEIIGDSMSPVLLGGQYAMVGPEYIAPYSQPGDYDIVVVSVDSGYDEYSEPDTRWDGVYCKRIVDAGDVWVFLSINHTGKVFTVMKKHCRLWPVIGVWFAGRGKPPRGD